MSWPAWCSALGAIFVAVLFVQVSSWDDEDFARMRAQAEQVKQSGVRYVVEKSGYRDAAYASAFHCRAPVHGERLVMQLASEREPGRGYRCVYWVSDRGGDRPRANVTWSRAPELSMQISSSGGTQP